MHKVLVIVGSLREGSLNAKLAGVLEKLAEGRLEFEYADLTDLPLYNDDLWSDVPEAVTRLKASVEAADGVLFVTPEYNRTFPGLIANVIHWASRPYGKNSWGGKPVAITGTSRLPDCRSAKPERNCSMVVLAGIKSALLTTNTSAISRMPAFSA